MDDLRHLRAPIRAVITKRVNEITTLMDATEPDDIEIRSNMTMLEGKQAELHSLNRRIYEIMEKDPQWTEDMFVKEILECEEYEKKILKVKYRYEREFTQSMHTAFPVAAKSAPSVAQSVNSLTSANDEIASSTSRSARREQRNYKLPRIEFIKFDGDAKQWLPFWSQFEKVHLDDDIDDADKVQYLTQATTSKARRLVESYPAVGTNYAKIIDALQSRFGREDLQIEIHIRELLKLILSTHTSEKIEVANLYDSLESHMRALETMGVTTEKSAAILFPLIESCLPESLLRQWQRSTEFTSQNASRGIDSLEDRLKGVMNFLRGEVENEQRIAMAQEGFGVRSATDKLKKQDVGKSKSDANRVPTAAVLHNDQSILMCLFCKGASHDTANCRRASKLSFEERQKLITSGGACFRCTKKGHLSKNCRTKIRCLLCDKMHATVLCPMLGSQTTSTSVPAPETQPRQQNLARVASSHVFLQTLRVLLTQNGKQRFVRALLDSGSQGSYILEDTAKEMGLVSTGTEYLAHALFGGAVTKPKRHDRHNISLWYENNHVELDVLTQKTICHHIPPVLDGEWTKELQDFGIIISDKSTTECIEILLGADVLGRIVTGRKHDLSCGLTAHETHLGWTLMGKVMVNNHVGKVNTTQVLHSLLHTNSISDLWDLEVLGIENPGDRVTREQAAEAAQKMFQDTVCKDDNGHYEVCLPWLAEHPVLPTNRGLAELRLNATMKRLKKLNLFDQYQEVLEEWLATGIIERMDDKCCINSGHYLPHRAVIKEDSATTKIRPVFDASAREKGMPSLNHCLEKGPNLIEMIPTILNKFRLFRIGVTADIRKAFLQISVTKRDRDVLKFLWVDADEQIVTYQHRRVVFGLNCSPFLLGATLTHHLKESGNTGLYRHDVIDCLLESFYVDNCVSSFDDQETVDGFVAEAQLIMANGKFDLRAWEWSGQPCEIHQSTPLLGMVWDKSEDVLKINPRCVEAESDSVITKRKILSITQRVFDPIGFTSPAMLQPKLLLQTLWETEIGWDAPIPDELLTQFLDWREQLILLPEIAIPRWVGAQPGAACSIHVFCDASLVAYAAAVFLRVRVNNEVQIHLLQSKSRVSPEKRKLTIPRLELMAALIGSRLYTAVKNCVKFEAEPYFWTDSTTSLAWIQRSEEWTPFVGNRVKEIRSLTAADRWRHVPGKDNPADLPSRGCDIRSLSESRWWEGPAWLRNSEDLWPTRSEGFKEEEIVFEKRKCLVKSMVCTMMNDLNLDRFGTFSKTMRVLAWVLRFWRNSKNQTEKFAGDLCSYELQSSEHLIWKIVQKETFGEGNDSRLKTLVPVIDNELIRVKTRIINREDTSSFRFPIVLPSEHRLVRLMIFEEHVKACHVGVQGLMSMLREKYWILGGRRGIKKAIASCVICRRYSAQPCVAQEAPLPKDRVRDAVPFEVTGVDFTGPLVLKGGTKAWICLFTCAIYRAVHLELCLSLSSIAFLQALRRFVSRRGRPATIFSDNGTNFVGANNILGNLDWEMIKRHAAMERIEWRFNPPSAPWWGGFWERLFGVLKPLLRKVLGRASLRYDELLTVLCDCEAVLNNRPLTHVSSDPGEPSALTPNCFLLESKGEGVVDLDEADRKLLTRRVVYQQRLRDELRQRFRLEYLGQLKLLHSRRHAEVPKVGEVVLIGDDGKKRIDWPLARVEELIQGGDGIVRVVKLRAKGGLLTRPIQRIIRLECDEGESACNDASAGGNVVQRECVGANEDSGRISPCVRAESAESVVATRRGRVVRKPLRFR